MIKFGVVDEIVPEPLGGANRDPEAVAASLKKVILKHIKELKDLFTENPRLIISPNNLCAGSCLHCVADSTISGETMPYGSFTSINPEFRL